MAAVCIVGAVVGALLGFLLVRFGRWVRARIEGPVIDECERGCSLKRDDRHLVVERFGDDVALGIDSGGTAMAAAFCGAHCPGGCDRGCVASRP